MVIIRRGVAVPPCAGTGDQVVQVWLEETLLVQPRLKSIAVRIGEAVHPHVLVAIGVLVADGKGVHHALGGGHHAPVGLIGGGRLVAGVFRQSVLEALAAVPQHVLTEVPQVDVEVATGGVLRIHVARGLPLGIAGCRIEGVHHPELYGLDVAGLEVRGGHAALDPCPVAFGIRQVTVVPQGRVVVVRAALGRVVRQIEHGDVTGRACSELAVGEHLAFQDFARAVVRIGAVRQGRLQVVVVEEQRVDDVPGDQGALEAGTEVVDVFALGEEVAGLAHGRRCQEPLALGAHVDVAHTALEVVDVAGSCGTDGLAVAGNEVSGLTAGIDGTRLLRVEERQLVHQAGDQPALAFPVGVQPQDGVGDRLIPHVHLLRERTLVEVHDRGADHQVLVHLVVEPRAGQGLGLDAEEGVALQAHIDRCTTFEDALVEDLHPAQVVVHRVVLVLHQFHAAGGHAHGALRDVHRVEADHVAAGALEAALELEPVQLRQVLCGRFRAVVEGLEHDVLPHYRDLHGIVRVGPDQLLVQVAAERLQYREEDAAVLGVDGAAHGGGVVLEVEPSVRVGPALLVQPVQAERLQQRDLVDRRFGDIVEVHAGGGVVVQQLQPEILRVHLEGAQGINVLHHQVPQRLPRIRDGGFQQAQHQRFGRSDTVRAELAHLIGLALERVLVGHGQHLVVVQVLVQPDEAQALVQSVFVQAQEPRALKLLIILAGLHAQQLQGGRRRSEGSDPRVVGHLGIQTVGTVGGLVARPVGDQTCIHQIRAHPVGRYARRAGILAQIGEGHDVPVVRVVAPRVGDPHLHLGHLHPTAHRGQRAHGVLVVVAEIVAEKVVLVGLVLVRLDIEVGGLCPARHRDILALALLLAEDGRGREPSELQLRLQAEEALAALDQLPGERQAHVARLDLLDDVVVVPGEIQFHLVLEIEGGLGVVAGVDLQLVTDVAH